LKINDTPVLNVEFSDNMEILKGLKDDPLVIKDIDIGSIHGVIDLMKTAVTNAPLIKEDALVLWGHHDDVIPQISVENFISRLPKNKLTSIFYEKGYHMLLRDLQAQRVWDDILNWIDDKDFKFSGELIIRDDYVVYRR
jgi:esterase/lipase